MVPETLVAGDNAACLAIIVWKILKKGGGSTVQIIFGMRLFAMSGFQEWTIGEEVLIWRKYCEQGDFDPKTYVKEEEK